MSMSSTRRVGVVAAGPHLVEAHRFCAELRGVLAGDGVQPDLRVDTPLEEPRLLLAVAGDPEGTTLLAVDLHDTRSGLEVTSG